MINSEPGARARALKAVAFRALACSLQGPGLGSCGILARALEAVVSWSGTKRPP